MKKIFKTLTICTIFILSMLLMGAALPENYDNNTAFHLTDLKAYIDKYKMVNLNNVFCIDQDKVLYYMKFSDTERDYPSNPTDLNNNISELVKTFKTNTLQIRYEHDPSCYLNPVVTNESKKEWQDITATYNSNLEKWQLFDTNGKEIILVEPVEEWRGEIIVYARAKDTAGVENYDEYGIGVTKFRIHKAPVPIFNVTTNGNIITLDGTKSYDYDGSYKNQEGNYNLDRGIKSYEWAVMIENEWKVIASGETNGQAIPKITYDTKGKQVQDYRLTVMDYDGAYASISKGMLVYKKPLPNFSYTVADKATEYSYKGNTGRETVKLIDNKVWNDDNFNELYPTSGMRTETWSSDKGLTASDINTYSTNLFNDFTNQITDGKITTTLYMKNKYDMEAEQTKALTVKNISITDESNKYYNISNGFKIGTEVVFQAKLSSDINVNDWTELRTEIECAKFYQDENGNAISIEMTRTDENTFYVKSSIPENVFGEIPYIYRVYSNRTNELIAQYDATFKIEGEAPIPYFHYTVNNQETTYAHRGNIGYEKVDIFYKVDWKDTGIGTRIEEWKAEKTGQTTNNKNNYVEILNNNFNNLVSNLKINSILKVTNIYNKSATTSKELIINDVIPNNRTNESYNSSNGCMVGTEVTFKFDLNTYIKTDYSEIGLKITSDILGLDHQELNLSGGVYNLYHKLEDTQNQWTDIPYTIDVYSNRTGQRIGTYNYVLPIATPITVKGYINESRENIELITDDVVKITAVTNKYAEKTEVKFPLEVIDTRTNTKIPANTYIKMDKYEENKWKVDIIIPSTSVTEETTIQVDYLATSFNKRDTATDKLFPKVITIKITDLRIECIRDIRWREYFTYDETDVNGNTIYNIPKGDSADIHFNTDGTNTYTNSTEAVQYYDRNNDGKYDDSKESIHFGYLLEFEIETIGLSETDTLSVETKFSQTNIKGLTISNEYKNVGMTGSYYKPEVKSVEGRKITWQFKYMLPYTDINDREYDKYESNPDYLTISFKPIAKRNETSVTYFKTEDEYAEIFKYYLPETARDDVYVENRN